MSTHVIATQGLKAAYWIAKAMYEQTVSQVRCQIAKHPDEWGEQIKRELQLLQSEPTTAKKKQTVPPPPPIL